MDAEATTKVGQLERKTQNRVAALLRDRLGYEYLGKWEEREGNNNIEVEYLHAFLVRSGYSERLIKGAIAEPSAHPASKI